MAKLVIGCGYVGHRLAGCWRDAGETVFVTTRSTTRAATFVAEGFCPIVLDVAQSFNDGVFRVDDMENVDTVVFAVGFDRGAGHSIDDVYVEGLRRVAAVCPPSVQRFIYISSTGVYGQTSGDWVNEATLCAPVRAGGKACLAAEQVLQRDDVLAAKTCVMRLAGIYGPERLPHVGALRRSEPLAVASDAWLNLIHADDIVRIVVAISKNDADVLLPATFCVSDGNPVLRGDFYNYLAELLKLPAPVFQPPVAGTSQAERARGSKRIRNQKLVETLDYEFLFPTFREGLREIVAAGA